MNFIYTKKTKFITVCILFLTSNVYAENIQNTLEHKNILRIGGNQTYLSSALEQNNQITTVKNNSNDINLMDTQSTALTEEKNTIEKEVSSADVVYANLKDNKDNEKVDLVVKEAIKQNKVIVLENMHKNQLKSYPMFFNAEVVIIKPNLNAPNRTITFGQQSPLVEHNIQDLSQQEQGNIILSQINTLYSENDKVLPTKFDDMLDYQKEQAFQQISESINTLLTPSTPAALMQINSGSSGGQIGYPCPAEAKQEQLCTNEIVTTNPVYYQNNNGAILNVVHGFSYAAYRTDSGTSIFVSPWGSANPTLSSNSESHRGYYLKQVRPEITVEPSTSAGMLLYRRVPENQNGSTTVSTTSGMSYDINASVSEKPSMGGKISYSTSQSQSTNLSDWATTTRSNTGYDAKWDYHLNKYKSISDWVSQKLFQKAKLGSIPSISANGIQYSAEAIWAGSNNTVSGNFNFNLKTYIVNERIYFTSNDIFHWNATAEWYTHTLYTGGNGVSFNTNWLKPL
ncbi:hypothetical protein [uncultured Shewanella sp.]|uniref:hypothetical protein n=1 Tax=uncultured Shewanella sp. TaxID=173975 RepID=UPI00262C7960|nr:hypothetical protein [uncultured Shewanella sp.]